MSAPEFIVREVCLRERGVKLRLPFHFGSATVHEATQAFVAVRLLLADGRDVWGSAAELMVPRWFDKDVALSNDDNVRQLRTALAMAREAYCAAGPSTAYGLLTRCNDLLLAEGLRQGLKDLVVNFGPAVIDRAILDALCKAFGMSFYQAMQRNLPGFTQDSMPSDLARFDMGRFLSGLRPTAKIFVRHTIGMADRLSAADTNTPSGISDDLPVSLEDVIARYGHRYFKIKIGGRGAADVERLAAIAGVLDRRAAPYWVTLDGNEQYEDLRGVEELLNALRSDRRLRRLARALLFLEQPINRARAFEVNVGSLDMPVIIDESDGNRDAFLQARECGYRGVSSKGCKGIYRAVINAARCMNWNGETTKFFMSAEDLTCPAGLAVQQDLALASLLSLGHVERNGHHYIGDMTGASPLECRAFQTAHPDLYEATPGRLRLRISAGKAHIASLSCTGFASGADPDPTSMREMSMENLYGG